MNAVPKISRPEHLNCPNMPVVDSVERAAEVTLVTRASGTTLRSMGRLIRGLVALLVVCAIAALGYHLCGWTWLDSIYMVVITISSVGYTEVRPVDTLPLRIWTILTIVFGYVAALMVISGLAQMVVDGELRKLLGIRRMMSEIQNLRHHVIICGYGRMGRLLADRLRERHRQVIIVDTDEDRVTEATEAGLLAIRGNATDEKTLQAAGIDRAATLASVVADDASNLFITITARGLNNRLQIFARGEQPSTVGKLRQVGANHVVLTAAIGADRLSQLILRPSAAAMLRNDELPAGLIEDLETLGLTLEELELREQSPLCGSTLRELRGQSSHSFLVVAVRRADGEVLVNPATDTELRRGDSVLVLAHDEHILQLCGQYDLVREPVGEEPAETAS